MELFTIGHSNHTIEGFISLLQQHEVTALADVRSHPYSRFLPHFKRKELKEALSRERIHYVFLGQELGARSNNPECYIDGKAVYDKIAATETFHEGIQKVLKGLKKHRITLMCAEQDPLICHRAILVCQHLCQFNLHINHILKNGELESHYDLEDRMLNKHGFNIKGEPVQLSLFDKEFSNLLTREECLEKAYKLQGDEIAYVFINVVPFN
ncbi:MULTISPECIES: DUF488 family protein [unclassified Coleofasciculus]|uniref:DUF488 domain-containing protein n=1 Tax=unclassified Coleofasciculus TaxID=2692782 RepID=UPI00187DEAE0|nr:MULTISPECIES: DUF488 domain-containing protein [unclassified Coleofasciculus]MBE9127607.1 DUF488 domain-containing protein [Coleofasciculus sp. LEGE 07081]MBE9150922.1 DUF488 domain-containing protein [Coleofasciculus sp. LEGE 07092]